MLDKAVNMPLTPKKYIFNIDIKQNSNKIILSTTSERSYIITNNN